MRYAPTPRPLSYALREQAPETTQKFYATAPKGGSKQSSNNKKKIQSLKKTEITVYC